MKIFRLVSISIILVMFTFQLSAQTSIDAPFVVEKLNDRVLLIKTGYEFLYPSNILAVSTEEGIIVMDTGSLPSIAEKAKGIIAREFGRKDFAYVIITHASMDHTYGLQAFAGIDIIAHEMCVASTKQALENRLDPQKFSQRKNGRKKRLDAMQKRLESMEKGSEEEKILRETFNYENQIYNETILSPDFKYVSPNLSFNDRMTVYFGDLTIRMKYNVISYSDSDILIYIPELKLINVGDVFNKSRLPWLNEKSDIPRWLEIFQEFLDKETEIEYVIGGHGDVFTMKEIRAQLAYLKELWEGIKTAKNEGLSKEQIQEKFSFDKFKNLLSAVDPFYPGTKMSMQDMNVNTILKMFDK